MPVTTNRSFCVPNTGDLSGAWGTSALNPNFIYLDTMFGGVSTIALSSATTFTLTIPPTTGTSAGANYQSNNAMIKFSGTLTGSATAIFSIPGFYIINNICTVASFVIKLVPLGGGNNICAPPGRKTHVFYDGADMDYVDMPEVGAPLNLHQSGTSVPAWITGCTVPPYLLRDGSLYSASVYPQLCQRLGSTFGGDGVTNFRVPDSLNRVDIGVDPTNANGRVTSLSGINGSTMGAAGGSQLLQSHNHTVSDSGHVHGFGGEYTIKAGAGGMALTSGNNIPGATQTQNATTGITNTNATGGGSSQNMMPAIISFLPLIKS